MDQLRIVVGFKVTPDYEALRRADWARAAAGRDGGDGQRRARPRPATSAASSTSSTRPRWSSRCACATRAPRHGLETSLAAFSVAGREADPLPQDAAGARLRGAPGWIPAPASTSPRRRRPRWSPPARRLGGDVLLLGAAAAPATAARCRSWSPRRSACPCLTQVTELEAAPTAAAPRDVRGRTAARLARRSRRRACSPSATPSSRCCACRRSRTGWRCATSRPDRALAGATLGVDVAGALARRAGCARRARDHRPRAAPASIVAGATPAEKARALYESHLRARLEQL